MLKVAFKGGDAGKPSLRVSAKGASLPLPAPLSGSEFMDLDSNVIVQLHVSAPTGCWQSEFSLTAVKRNDGEDFKAVAP